MNSARYNVSSIKAQGELPFCRIVFSLLLLIASFSVKAQDSLSIYLELADKHNPGLQAKYLEYSAALEKVPQAGALPDPSAELGFYLKPMELTGGNQVSSIRLMQMFPWFGTLKVAKDEASQMAVMKFEEAREARNMAHKQVKTSWYRIYQKKKEIDILNENMELLRTLEKLALSAYTNMQAINSGANMSQPAAPTEPSSMNGGGMGGMNGSSSVAAPLSRRMAMNAGNSPMKQPGSGMVDVLRVQMEIAELENRVAAKKDQLITETARFNRLLNRSPESPVFVPDSLIAGGPLTDLKILSDSLQNNPMLQMTLAEKAAGQAQQAMASRMGKPMLGIGANYMLIEKRAGNTSMMNGKDMAMPMVSFTIPVFSRKYKTMEREAEFRIEASEKAFQNTRNELQVAFQETIEQYHDANRRLELYQKQAALAQTSVRLLTTAFSASETTMDEVLRMQEQLLGYRLNKLQALTDLNVAEAQLQYLAGVKNRMD
jgi:outer membrane protein TolC